MKKRYYIAYGSNLNTEQMRWRCPDAEVIGTSVIENYELLFKGSLTGSYFTIEKAEGHKVPVAIWEVSEGDEHSLDCYEGFPHFYYKTEMTLSVKDIDSDNVRDLECFVYIMREESVPGIPSYEYVKTCADGYKAFGFDQKYINEALTRTMEAVDYERKQYKNR